MRVILITSVLILLTGCDFIGGGETVVRGSNNFVGEDDSSSAVAYALAHLEGTPEVTDDELAEIYEKIRSAALDGNLESAQVLLRLAAIQRAPDPEDD